MALSHWYPHIICNKAWFPYDRPCSDDRDDHMETLPRRSQTTRIASKFTRSSRSSGYNSILSMRSRSSQSSGSFAIVWVAFPYDRPDRLNWHFFETTGTIRTIIWKPGFSEQSRYISISCLLAASQFPSINRFKTAIRITHPWKTTVSSENNNTKKFKHYWWAPK